MTPRVLMALGAYYPEISGGGLQAREVIRRLRDRVDFTVITTSAVSDESTQVDGVPVHRIRLDPTSLASRGRSLGRFVRLLPTLSRAAGVVHLQSVSQKNLPLTLLAGLLRRPLILTLHTGVYDDAERMRREDAWTFRAMRRATIVTAVSPGLLDSARRAGLTARLRLVPNGVDLDRFRAVRPEERRALRRRLGLPEDRTLILFVGFFSREKGPHRLFEAWSCLPVPLRERSTIVFVGRTALPHTEVDPALAGEIRRQAATAGATPVFVEHTLEIEHYYQAADLFVLASTREGFPVALLEAMATGLPVVSSRLPGSTDALVVDGVNGVSVPPGDVDALMRALHRVLDNAEEAARLGAAARATIVDAFSLDAAAQAYLNLYTALSQPSRRPSAEPA